jgi:two-component system response regulator YesN
VIGMFKVFFVDDEEFVIMSLQASLDWEEYGFELAGYALNGEEAFEQIRLIQPDVVFTDIRMPGTSGLELIKRLKEASSRALFIVVSGYAEFAFAQKAIKYGAFGYCLKPFDEEEIIGYLKKAKRLLEETTNSGEMRILELIEDDSEDARKELSDALDAAGIHMDSEADKYIVVSVGKIGLKLDRLGSCISLKIGYNKYVYVLQTGDESRLWSVLKESPADIRGIGVSNPFGRIEELRHAIDTAELRVRPQQELYIQGGKNRTFNLIYQYIHDNFSSNVSIQSIAKEFNVNAKYVSQLFKKELGTTFTEYVSKLRIEYACKLIASTDLPINEIAEKAGYDDYFYFSRIFKRLMGTTPSAYRKQV